MGKILFASELGGGLGHLAKLKLLADPLVDRGYQVSAAVNNASILPQSGNNSLVTTVTAPAWPSGVNRSGPALNYSEILARRGYCLPGRLEFMMQRWLKVIEQSAAEQLIADHAPTALLAARVAGITPIRVGTGFQSPPAASPYPVLLGVPEGMKSQRVTIDRLVLRAINKALQAYKTDPVESMDAALQVEKDFLCTFAETDHYAERSDAHYSGPLYLFDGGISPAWPPISGPRLFVYVAGSTPALDKICHAINALHYPAILYARDLNQKQRDKHRSAYIQVADRPVDMGQVLSQSQFCITNGSHGTTLQALLTGCPVLMCPVQVEQCMFARRIVQQGMGLALLPDRPMEEWQAALVKLVDTVELSDSARNFAAKHKHYDPRRSAADIARQISRMKT